MVEALTMLGHVAVEVLLRAEAREKFLSWVHLDLAWSFHLHGVEALGDLQVDFNFKLKDINYILHLVMLKVECLL